MPSHKKPAWVLLVSLVLRPAIIIFAAIFIPYLMDRGQVPQTLLASHYTTLLRRLDAINAAFEPLLCNGVGRRGCRRLVFREAMTERTGSLARDGIVNQNSLEHPLEPGLQRMDHVQKHAKVELGK